MSGQTNSAFNLAGAQQVDVDVEAQRRAAQLAFVKSGQDVLVGSLADSGITLDQLQSVASESPEVIEAFTDGLTAIVYHIELADKEWNLKVKRPESLVRNVDGQTSFLNEVQRRRDFAELKTDPAIRRNPRARRALSHLVDTRYASFLDGIMLSPWIPGERLDEFNESILEQIFATTVQLELNGFLEWDMCPGNILYNGENIRLFDFGYCYRFDPLRHFNSCGLNAPMFHSVERLETRNFFGYLLKRETSWSHTAILSLFELEKRLAVEAYEYKYTELKQRGASESVLSWLEDILQRWKGALRDRTALEQLFILESYRSHTLDIHDDLSGKSCTPMTLSRIAKVQDILQLHYDYLLHHGGLLFGDENLSKQALLEKTGNHRRLAQQYQL